MSQHYNPSRPDVNPKSIIDLHPVSYYSYRPKIRTYDQLIQFKIDDGLSYEAAVAYVRYVRFSSTHYLCFSPLLSHHFQQVRQNRA